MNVEKMNIGSLREEELMKLAKMLDRSTCGWKELANAAAAHDPRFRCSERERTSCSMQVLSAAGSPARFLLAWLADRSCSLDFLLHCLKKIGQKEGVQFLTAAVAVQIQITVQPQSQQAVVGSVVKLSCRACGPPDLTYQWFRGKDEIHDKTGDSQDLVLSPLLPSHQSHYICRINHGENYIFSQWAHVSVIDSSVASPGSNSIFSRTESRLRITLHPLSQSASEGESLFLECKVEASPPAQYEWYHNMVAMFQHKSSSLKIPCVTTAHRGQYRCKVFNLYHHAWSDTATVIVEPSSITESSWVEIDRATDKVALLIGNMHYHHHTQLSAPIADVHELANLLRQMDFKVVSLLNLNLQEMHRAVTGFLLLLDKGVYGLLYFSGHGYENYGNSFMVPIDAPASYTSEHCLCVQDILTRMQEKETGLNVFLLDMCRKRNPYDDVIVQPGLLKVTADIVFGYATCIDAEAYEVKREEREISNGIFISFLKQRVSEDEKVTVMLDRVAEDMGRCKITQGRQALELRSNLSERRSLTDRIQITYCPTSYSARNQNWAKAHDLPLIQSLQFECGVKVQLGFAAEFSNVMVIYSRILEKLEEISFCSAQLTDFPEVCLSKSNQETLLEAGSLLMIEGNLPPSESSVLYTRVSSLQRLKKELTFTVCLHYTYSDVDDEIQERQLVTVGKPLVAKLKLHELKAFETNSGSSSFTLDSFNVPECSSLGDGLTSGEALTITNTPEETNSPELLDAPKPLVAS
uniref:Mucosa-associated lymphoid tissue lymphoma translocation protein 1-like n=1 Tax=Gouania willdenowi TaxID=441366 RepID=A0A8C5EIW2_GOUWI